MAIHLGWGGAAGTEGPRSGSPRLGPGTASEATSARRTAGRLDHPASLQTRALIELLGGPASRPEPLSQDGELLELSRCEVSELVAERGLRRSGALRLAAAFELAKRLRRERRPPRPSVRSPARVHRLLEDEVRGAEQECFFVLLLDGKHALRRIELVSLGTLTTSLVHPREVFRPAVRAAAAALVCAHNHPSGDPEPSAEDVEVTRRLLEAGRLLGIPLLDHVVLGDGRYVSLRERMGF